MVIFLLFSSFFRSNLTEKFICQQFTFYLTQPTFALHLILCLDRCDTIFASITNDPEHWCFLFSSLLSSTLFFSKQIARDFDFFEPCLLFDPLDNKPNRCLIANLHFCTLNVSRGENSDRWKLMMFIHVYKYLHRSNLIEFISLVFEMSASEITSCLNS